MAKRQLPWQRKERGSQAAIEIMGIHRGDLRSIYGPGNPFPGPYILLKSGEQPESYRGATRKQNFKGMAYKGMVHPATSRYSK